MEESLKDKWSKKVNKDGNELSKDDRSNWIETVDALRKAEEMKKNISGIKEIKIDDEYFIVTREDGRIMNFHRWKKFDYAPNGQNIEGERTIEQEIENFAKESK